MKITDILKQYLDKEITAIETIRRLSAIFNPDVAEDLLVLINQVARHEQGDFDTDTFKRIYKIG